MKTKTTKQLAAQTWRMLSQLASHKMTPAEEARFNKIIEIKRRYRANMMAHIKSTGIDRDSFGVLPVSIEIYTK